MAPDDALAYLHSFPDWERGTAGNRETYTLERMRRLLGLLDHPDRAFPIVHVVGTKGKGSTAAMIAAGLRAAGYRTGLFTSPHLLDYRERVRVDGRMIPPDALASLVDERLRPAVERLRAAGERTPLHFELQCALALEHFRRSAVAIAVLEAGLGGRLDATNAVSATRLTVITPIGHDHTAVLGDTLEEIAGEKAAVVRPGGSVIAAPQPAAAMAVIERVCRERGARLEMVGRDWGAEVVEEGAERTVVDVYGPGVAYERLCVPLAGAHQAANAAVAVAALTQLYGGDNGHGAIRSGLAAARWPGRLQIAARDPLVLLDGAHNAESAAALAGALTRIYAGAPFVVVLAIFGDKDPAAILGPLAPLAARVVVTATAHPRALPAAALAGVARRLGLEVEEAPSVAAALGRAMAGRTGVLVTGSLRTVGEAMLYLGIPVGDG